MPGQTRGSSGADGIVRMGEGSAGRSRAIGRTSRTVGAVASIPVCRVRRAAVTPFMARALELADLARGRTSPNPAVGAVVERDGVVVGEGFSQPPGGPHAEVVALRQAGALAAGARLWVTLEPCNHHGRTPPCVDAVLAAGIAEVQAAMEDPFPLVAGAGIRRLRAGGVAVSVGQGAREAAAQNEGFLRHVADGRPAVAVKWAASLDGRIATRTGDSRWITGPAARARVHDLRDCADAILVGSGTVRSDDPRLTVRLAEPRRPARPPPLRVVVDGRGAAPLTAQLFGPALASGTLVVTTTAMPAEHRSQLIDRGVEVVTVPARAGGSIRPARRDVPEPSGPDGTSIGAPRVDLAALVDLLGARGLRNLFVEGGGTLVGALFDARLVDRLYAFLAPIVIGGVDAPGAVGGGGIARLTDAARLVDVAWEQLGPDCLVSGRVDFGLPAPDAIAPMLRVAPVGV